MQKSSVLPVLVILAAVAAVAAWKLSPELRERFRVAGGRADPAPSARAPAAPAPDAAPRPAPAPAVRAVSAPPAAKSQAAAPFRADDRAPAGVAVRQDAEADAPDPDSMTPEQRKAKYDELTERMRALREKIMRANVERSEEGRAALEVTAEYKRAVAEAKRMEAQYGRADERVARKHAELAALKARVRAANDTYKAWKASNPGQTSVPEEDPEYRELQALRSLYR